MIPAVFEYMLVQIPVTVRDGARIKYKLMDVMVYF